MRSRQRQRAFTLVELLVAISILAIVAVLGWRGLDTIVRARTGLTDQMETTRGMQLAFAQMQNDCERIANRSVLDQRPFLQIAPDRITLVRQVFTENQPARLLVVSYRIVNSVLVRRESQPTRDMAQLDALWQAALSDTDTSGSVALEGNVVGMLMATWQNNAWRQAGSDPSANAGSGATTPQNQLAAQLNPAAQALETTGLQVALQVQGQPAPLLKSFLLGEP